MSVLKIKDQNGNWIQIPTIKGEDGQDYILTENDKQEIAGLIDAPVEDVQVNGTSVVSNGVANISISEPEPEGMVVKTTLVSGNQYTIDSTYDTIKTTLSFGINVIVMAQDVPQPYVGNVQMDGVWYLAFGVSTTYNNYATLVGFLIPETYQNIAVWVDQSVHIPVLDDSDVDINIVWSSSKINDELSQKVDDIQINGTSIVTSGVANIPIGYAKTGLIRISGNSDVTGLYMNSSTGATVVHKADDNQVKAGTMIYRPITPSNQHSAVFYGLAKASGDTTQSQSDNEVGIYTNGAKSAIQSMLGVPSADDVVTDVQVNGTSIVTNGTANIPIANGQSILGVAKYNSSLGVSVTSDGTVRIFGALSDEIKAGISTARSLTPKCQHESVFYGLAKAAGDTTQSSSSNTVGTYTDEAKTAIKQMLDVKDDYDSLVVEVSGTDPVITGKPSYRYNCGELYTLTITPPASGTMDIIFTSGTTPTVLSLPNTVKMPDWWAGIETNTTYEMCITDGTYCGVMSWAT